MEEETIRKSIFNSALQYTTIELSGIRQLLHEARIIHNYSRRYDLLVCFYQALSAKMTRGMLKEHGLWFNIVTDDYNRYEKLAFSKQPIPKSLFQTFDKWEMALRKAENKLGLLTAENMDPSQALTAGNY